MFSTTKKKVMAVAVMTAMLLAGFGMMSAQAHQLPSHVCQGPAGEHNPHCQPGHGNPGGNPGHDHDCEIISVEIDGIDIDICVLVVVDVDIDIDHLLHVLHLLHLVDAHDRLEWLGGHLSLGEDIDWLLDKIDLYDLFEKLDWLEPDGLFGLISYIGHGAYNEGMGLLDLGLLDGIYDGGNGGGGGDDCSGLVNVCNNANGSLNDLLYVNDVVDVCAVNADNGFGNGPGDDGNADCDVVDASGVLGGDDALNLNVIGNVLVLTGLF